MRGWICWRRQDLTIELVVIAKNTEHSSNEIDMTDMKNTIDTQTDVVTHQAIRFASSDNADVNALSSSLFEYVESNNVEANFCRFHRMSMSWVRFLMVENRFLQETPQGVSQEMWQTQAAHQSNKNYECVDYIFVFATEVNGKTTIELDDALEENFMTVYVKTINGKTTSFKCDKKKESSYENRMKLKEYHRSCEARHTLHTKEK